MQPLTSSTAMVTRLICCLDKPPLSGRPTTAFATDSSSTTWSTSSTKACTPFVQVTEPALPPGARSPKWPAPGFVTALYLRQDLLQLVACRGRHWATAMHGAAYKLLSWWLVFSAGSATISFRLAEALGLMPVHPVDIGDAAEGSSPHAASC